MFLNINEIITCMPMIIWRIHILQALFFDGSSISPFLSADSVELPPPPPPHWGWKSWLCHCKLQIKYQRKIMVELNNRQNAIMYLLKASQIKYWEHNIKANTRSCGFTHESNCHYYRTRGCIAKTVTMTTCVKCSSLVMVDNVANGEISGSYYS